MMSDTQPLVCICIPTYNAERTIQEMLASIVNQSYSNMIIHVVDNASTDRTLAHVGMFDDPRISIYRNEINIGGGGNNNRCIQLARGKYTAIYHADDVYEPHMVERQVAFLEANPVAGAVFTEASLIDENGKMIGDIHLPRGMASVDHLYDFADIFKAVLQHSNFLICPSTMVRMEVYQQESKHWLGEVFKSSADLDVWFRILQHHPIGILIEPSMRYRISESQYSARVRLRTGRADFFLVMDYYLARDDVKAMLTTADLRNYARLERTDRAIRASNLFLLDRREEADALCSGVLSRDGLCAAIQSRSGFLTLLLAGYLKLCLALGLTSIGKAILRKAKLISHR